MDENERELYPAPSWLWYLAAIVWTMLGIGLGVVGAVRTAADTGNSFVAAKGPGVDTVKIKETGRQSIYYEDRSPPSDAPPLIIRITDEQGQQARISEAAGTATYNLNGRYGSRTAMVTIPRPGTYTVVTGREDELTEPYKLQIGTLGISKVAAALLKPIGYGALLTVMHFILVFILRRRAGRTF